MPLVAFTHLRQRGAPAIRTRPRLARSRSVRLSVQDSRLSRGKGGFDSRTERQNTFKIIWKNGAGATLRRTVAQIHEGWRPAGFVQDAVATRMSQTTELVSVVVGVVVFLGVVLVVKAPDMSRAQADRMPVGSARVIASCNA